MSDTQSYKTVTLTGRQLTNVVAALVDRIEMLEEQVESASFAQWMVSAANYRSDIACINELIQELSL